MNRFVFLHDPITVEKENEFLGFMKGIGVGNYWKWTPCAWLFVDAPGDRPVRYIVDGFMRINPDVRCFAFEFGDVLDWRGLGPSSGEQDMFKWVEAFWKTSQDDRLSKVMLGEPKPLDWTGYKRKQ